MPRVGRYLPAAPDAGDGQLEPCKAGDNCGQGHAIAPSCFAVTRGRRRSPLGAARPRRLLLCSINRQKAS